MAKLAIDKDDFVEFLHQAAEVRSLTFSTNRSGFVWPCDKLGFHHESERRYIQNPSYLLKISIAEYLKYREKGGRFRIDFHGIYCHETNQYIVRWIKSADLVTYQTSTPLYLKKWDWIDVYRLSATPEINEV